MTWQHAFGVLFLGVVAFAGLELALGYRRLRRIKRMLEEVKNQPND